MTGDHVTSGHHMREQGPRPPRDINRPDTDMCADGLWFASPGIVRDTDDSVSGGSSFSGEPDITSHPQKMQMYGFVTNSYIASTYPEVVYHVLDVIISFEFDYDTLCCTVCG